jgi:hypothetical protein
LLVYTGDGKGKSSAAFGVMLRSVALGWPVVVLQFVKSGDWKVGEEKIGRQLGVEPSAFGATPFAAASPRRTIQGHHRDRQAAQEAHDHGASFFFNRTERDLGRGDHVVHVARCFRTRARFGQETRDVQVGLSPRLLMHCVFDGGEARGVAYQTFEPLLFAFAQDASRLVRYSSGQGQFITEDPTFLALGNPTLLQQLSQQDQQRVLSDPQQMNAYSYGRDNPITMKDPSGNSFVGEVGVTALHGAEARGITNGATDYYYTTYGNPLVPMDQQVGKVIDVGIPVTLMVIPSLWPVGGVYGMWEAFVSVVRCLDFRTNSCPS